MTLSHCWGDSKGMLKLTSDTYKHRMKDGFSYAELPKTFQDFIRLSRFLHNEYVWIDSLCIIQDSLDDWIQESKTMADVYLHSKCNIAATGSQGPSDGCFYPRELTLVSPLEILLRTTKAEDNRFVKRYLFFDDRIWHRNVENGPLNRRSWVLQERILAPRQIHCGREQLLWECYQTTACETFPFILDRIRSVNINRRGEVTEVLSRLQWVTPEEKIAHMRHSIYQDWTRIVSWYSTCSLSRRTDKLVAIFGISSRIQDGLKNMDSYVAGLWRSQLPWQLLWKRDTSSTFMMDIQLPGKVWPLA
ncbi:heterokaryon incompatibility protein-domain-containing protein [Annulohypoxylon bovei var. microspora]|nr:heterokaryon incompatibility protein-domain-containing protein [Annulohypoxylon bovei var. microspora]